MKNLYKLSSLLLVALLVFQLSCSEDETPAPDNTSSPVGEWTLATATLVDGNAQTTDVAEDLTVANYPVNPIPVGDVQNTSVLVGGALAKRVCEETANFGGFYIELATNGKLIFYCPAEEVVDDSGSWTISEQDGSYTVSLNVTTDAGPFSIFVTDFEVAADGSTMTGRATNYPMVQDLAGDLALDNLQVIVVDLAFTAKQ